MIAATFLGHACWLIKTGDHQILIDPFLTGNPVAGARAEDVKADYVLITHGHSDHTGDALEIAKRCSATIVGCFEVATYFQLKGAQVHPMHLGGSHEFPFGRVKLTPALHGAGLVENGQIVYLGNPAGFLLELGDKTIYHSGDTALFSDMKLVGRRRKVDLAMLPIGDNFTMGIDDAVEATRLIDPVQVVPMHYNTFDLVSANPEEFARRVHDETNAKCVILKPGQTIEV